MSALFDNIHTTRHGYARAVTFGEDRDQFLPRARRELGAVARGLSVPPAALPGLAAGPRTPKFSVSYDEQERRLLAPHLVSYDDHADGVLRAWASQFVRSNGATDARQLLLAMSRFIAETMEYQARFDDDVQTPCDTLLLQSGTERDFAMLMIEAIRHLGYAARFASGDLHGPRPEGLAPAARADARAKCAWLQVYQPAEGWIPFNPSDDGRLSANATR